MSELERPRPGHGDLLQTRDFGDGTFGSQISIQHHDMPAGIQSVSYTHLTLPTNREV